MAMFIRAKRVLDPQDDERIKARFRHSVASSGSEHDGEVDTSAISGSGHGLIYGFFEDDLAPPPPSSNNDCDEVKDGSDDNSGAQCPVHVKQTLHDLLNPYKKPDCQFRLRLHADVVRAAHTSSDLQSTSGPACYRRVVMARLRDVGYDAGICKSRWDASGGLIAGSYEYIDVLVADEDKEVTRYIVDLEFGAEFEVARATREYEELTEELPRVMVGRGDELRGVVRTMGDAARRSLRAGGLSLPPWRKSRYMIAKWLGPYRRTINPLQPSPSAVVGGRDVKCRMVGFAAATQVAGINIPFY